MNIKVLNKNFKIMRRGKVKCSNCGKAVQPTKKFSWVLFIILLLLFGVPGLIYLIYYWSKTAKLCPACGKNVYN